MTFEFNPGWPDSFLDVWRHEGKDKVMFDGFYSSDEDHQDIPAYMFGVQALWHLKVSSGTKGYFVSASVQNPGQFGNSAIIHIYRVRDDGTLVQMEYPYAVPVKIEFNGEGN